MILYICAVIYTFQTKNTLGVCYILFGPGSLLLLWCLLWCLLCSSCRCLGWCLLSSSTRLLSSPSSTRLLSSPSSTRLLRCSWLLTTYKVEKSVIRLCVHLCCSNIRLQHIIVHSLTCLAACRLGSPSCTRLSSSSRQLLSSPTRLSSSSRLLRALSSTRLLRCSWLLTTYKVGNRLYVCAYVYVAEIYVCNINLYNLNLLGHRCLDHVYVVCHSQASW